MADILIVEDSPEFQILLKRTLSDLSTDIQVCSTAQEARVQLKDYQYHLILLDISLPDQDGLQFFGELKADEKTKDIAVIFLTGQADVSYKVTAFSLGAEDYIVKPFNPLELKARVEAKLKKSLKATESHQTITKGALTLDASTLRAYEINGENRRPIQLTAKEFMLLFNMARHEERVFTRDQLLTAVWGENVQVFDRTIDSHVSSIRKKLGDLGRYVESVSGQGYRFSTAAQGFKRKSAA